jgi:hypothetical protein
MKALFFNCGLPVFVSLAGFGFLCLGGGKLYLNRVYAQQGVQTLATVTYYTSRSVPNPVASSYAEYRFKTADGLEMKGHQNGYYVRVGEEVKIEYLPNFPEWNRFSGARRINEGWNIPMAIVGFIFFLAGIYAFTKSCSRASNRVVGQAPKTPPDHFRSII